MSQRLIRRLIRQVTERPWLRPRAAVFGLALALAAGCGADPKGRLGDPCGSDSECESGLCYEGVCLDPLGDEDGDGLLNGVEVSLTTDPFDSDTDGDGRSDPDEVGSIDQPLDEDGDGWIDAVESLETDADRDCLVDQRDAFDATPAEELPELVAEQCSDAGVCHDAPERRVRCTDGVPSCVLDAVPGYEAAEVTCDGEDNDCNGTADDTVSCAADGPCVVGRCDGRGGCVVEPVDKSCDDGDACTENDRCRAGVCEGGGAVACDDGNPCTDDACEPASGCVFTDNSAPCDDGDACTGGDVCAGGVCGGAPLTFDCGVVGADDDCDGVTDEDCGGSLQVRSFEYTGGTTDASDGVLGLRARIAPTPFHAAGGHSSDGEYVLTPGVPLNFETSQDE